MAIKSNTSEEEVAGGDIKLYTGIIPMKVLAVNPTLAELHGMDIMFQKEPKYQVQFEGNDGPTTKVVFWLGNEDTKVPLEILVIPGLWKSKTGKVKWLNISGDDLWSEIREDGTPNPDHMKEWHKDTDTFYPCPRGIDTLTNFVKAWANVASGDEVKLETVKEISKGDVSELRELIKVLKGNSVRVLVYVRDGKYQAVYTEHFGRLRPERNDLFTKAMGGNPPYSQIDGEFSLPWQVYSPGVVVPDENSTSITEDVPTEEDWLADEPPVDQDAF